MRKTRLALVLLLFVTGLFVFHGWTRNQERSRITEEELDRIDLGMTQQEVEAILGCPPGNYHSGNVTHSIDADDTIPAGDAESWFFDAGGLTVWFEKGKVTAKMRWMAHPNQSWLDRIWPFP